MAIRNKSSQLSAYPRRTGGYLAEDSLFPKPAEPLAREIIAKAIVRAFERCLMNKQGEIVPPPQTPKELVSSCLKHLRERGDPIISPSFYCQVPVEKVFELDAVPYEMHRYRMKLGNFYQFLVIELLRARFPEANVLDGKKEGDAEAEIHPPGLEAGLRLFISVKKSGDTVGGQDVEGQIKRLEKLSRQDKNLTGPYLNVICVATPPRGRLEPYDEARHIRMTEEGQPYSPNTEVWMPGFIFPYLTGLEPNEIYEMAREVVSDYLAFHALARREECSKLLADELRALDLVDEETGRLDPDAFAKFISQPRATKPKTFNINLKKASAKYKGSAGETEATNSSSASALGASILIDEEDMNEPAGQ
jgi:hypothetical protein